MSILKEIPEKLVLDRSADESGLAIVVIDEGHREISTSNNNSICRNLNPNGVMIGPCAAFCGTALAETKEVGASVSFTCHAGLECRAIPFMKDNSRLVAIVGRTFVKAENYHRATERAISGDWSAFSPADFFENILLTGSREIVDKAARQLEDNAQPASKPSPVVHAEPKPLPQPVAAAEPVKLPDTDPLDAATRPIKKAPAESTSIVDKFVREVRGQEPIELIKSELKPELSAEPVIETKQRPIPAPVSEPLPEAEIAQISTPEPKPVVVEKDPAGEKRTAESRAWRSFFGSLLKTDYPKAVESILEFLARHYNFTSLVWLESTGERFENTASFGEMKTRKVRLGIAPNDPRLLNASQNEVPLELGERPKENSPETHRTMHLFPMGVGGEVSAAIAAIEPIHSEEAKVQIARICHSIAPQLEILRLRSDVARRERLGGAVRRFSESIKTIDAEDFWLNLTQNAAEMLQAERGSLLVYDDREDRLEIKALIGSRAKFDNDEAVGSRVAKIVFSRNEPVVIPDVEKTGLKSAGSRRNYRTPSFMSCPINIGGRTIGVMNFADRADEKPFDKASLELFQAIAPQLAIAIDRATLKEKAGEFEQLSVTDALTGLLNRRYIEERLMEEIKRSNRHGFPMSFMMLDVDHFKSYNDQFGHPAGDEALKLVGHVIRETLRGADVAARYGGEEFAILLPQTTAFEAATIAERIRLNIEQEKFPHRRVTMSIGVASCSAELCSSPHLISAADKALYEAKRQGRNRVRAFEEMTGVGAEPVAR